MSTKDNVYVAPMAELFLVPKSFRLLVSLSAEAGIEDWEEGAEL